MAAENIGSLYPTKVPGYDDPADIQAALKLFHYGSATYDPTNTDVELIPTNSIAGHLKTLSDRLDDQEELGTGSEYSSTKPSTPLEGFIWVDSNSTAITEATPAAASYVPAAPTIGLTVGMLWVDSSSSPLKMYVYSGTEWKEIGA